jgi:threonyl-tRNA synthetase
MIHTDTFHYHVTDKTSVTKLSKPLTEDNESMDIGECLVAFIASEKVDESNIDSVIEQGIESISVHAEKVSADTIMVYPYAHLSSDLSSPKNAQKVLDGVYSGLDKMAKFKMYQAPFGWYKSFNVACKGHPLSENARTILPDGVAAKGAKKVENKAVAAEAKMQKVYKILDLNHNLVDEADFDFKNHQDFKKLVDYDLRGTRADEAPAHVKIMKEHELVDYEPGSDAGNLRWYPKGQLVKRLLETHCNRMIHEYGGMQVETPIMYDFDHPKLSKYLNRFPARQYVVSSEDKEYFLRFAACFGQYLMSHDMNISYRDLPVRLYEMTHYSFRREQTGELSGLKRLRCFTMPDMHSLCRDIPQAKEEFIRQFELSVKWMKDLDFDFQICFRFVEDFFYENKDFIDRMQDIVGKPFLIELWKERFFYFVTKFEFNILDSQGKASTLSTVQIDVENTELFDISYTDEKSEKHHMPMLHTSITGAIDRNLHALLEKQAMAMKKGQKAMWPLWLAPTQVRFIPVSEKYVEAATALMQDIPFRADLDDRDLSLGKRIRGAEKEWVPYIVVIGEDEKESGKLTVRVRGGGNKQESWTPEELTTVIREQVGDKPYERLPLPVHLSRRPIFVG